MILTRLPVSSDLSQTSYEVAAVSLIDPMLHVAPEDVQYAERLRVPYVINLRLMKGTWYVMGLNGGKFSPGVY